MLVKYFRHGKGNSSGVMNYMFGAKNEREKNGTARVMAGDRKLTSMLIDSNPHKQKYTSGCLSFEEKADSISEEKKLEIMREFEQVTFPGLDPEQYNFLWIEHSDKNGRLELNFVIPRQEMMSGKSICPYYHSKDEKRVNAWKTMINADNNFSDPDEPARKRLAVDYDDFGRNEMKAEINKIMLRLLEKNKLKNESDVRRELSKIKAGGINIKIEKINNSSITISHPRIRSKNNKLRLKGGIYEKGFKHHPKKEQATADDFLDSFNILRQRQEQEQSKKEKTLEELLIEKEKWRKRVDIPNARRIFAHEMSLAEDYNKKRYPHSVSVVKKQVENKQSSTPTLKKLKF